MPSAEQLRCRRFAKCIVPTSRHGRPMEASQGVMGCFKSRPTYVTLQDLLAPERDRDNQGLYLSMVLQMR